jgi:hypothetical protein
MPPRQIVQKLAFCEIMGIPDLVGMLIQQALRQYKEEKKCSTRAGTAQGL